MPILPLFLARCIPKFQWHLYWELCVHLQCTCSILHLALSWIIQSRKLANPPCECQVAGSSRRLCHPSSLSRANCRVSNHSAKLHAHAYGRRLVATVGPSDKRQPLVILDSSANGFSMSHDGLSPWPGTENRPFRKPRIILQRDDVAFLDVFPLHDPRPFSLVPFSDTSYAPAWSPLRCRCRVEQRFGQRRMSHRPTHLLLWLNNARLLPLHV